jgi:hypothetical protein
MTLPAIKVIRLRAVPLTVAIAVLLGFAIARASQATAGQDAQPLQLTVLSEEDGNGVIEVRLRNSGKKPVEEWGVSVYADGRIESTAGEQAARDNLFAPGETKTLRVAARGSRDLRICAVFSDRTAAGDPTALANIFYRRAQGRDELARWVGQLREVVKEPQFRIGDVRSKAQAIMDDLSASVLVKGFAGNTKMAIDQSLTDAECRQRIRAILTEATSSLVEATAAAIRRG